MWAWILSELQKAVTALPMDSAITGIDKDDIVSIVILYLCEDQKLAVEIYKNQKIGLLYQLVKCELYEQKSRMFFNNKMELTNYNRIMDVCQKYNIEAKKENAYKISALLEDTTANLNITGVISLLSMRIPLNNGYSRREESYEGMNYETRYV